jgi:hypothetical protein
MSNLVKKPLKREYPKKAPNELQVSTDFVRWRGKDRMVLRLEATYAGFKVTVAGDDGVLTPVWVPKNAQFQVRPEFF